MVLEQCYVSLWPAGRNMLAAHSPCPTTRFFSPMNTWKNNSVKCPNAANLRLRGSVLSICAFLSSIPVLHCVSDIDYNDVTNLNLEMKGGIEDLALPPVPKTHIACCSWKSYLLSPEAAANDKTPWQPLIQDTHYHNWTWTPSCFSEIIENILCSLWIMSTMFTLLTRRPQFVSYTLYM